MNTNEDIKRYCDLSYKSIRSKGKTQAVFFIK